MRRFLRQLMMRRRLRKASVRPIFLDRINLQCPFCKWGGMWRAPEGCRIAIETNLIVTCRAGHQWRVAGIYAQGQGVPYEEIEEAEI